MLWGSVMFPSHCIGRWMKVKSHVWSQNQICFLPPALPLCHPGWIFTQLWWKYQEGAKAFLGRPPVQSPKSRHSWRPQRSWSTLLPRGHQDELCQSAGRAADGGELLSQGFWEAFRAQREQTVSITSIIIWKSEEKFFVTLPQNSLFFHHLFYHKSILFFQKNIYIFTHLEVES